MDLKVLPLLRCPTCWAGDIRLERACRIVSVQPGGSDHLWEGILRCPACSADYLVHESVAVLLPHDRLTAEEQTALALNRQQLATELEVMAVPPKEVRLKAVAELIAPKYDRSGQGSAGDQAHEARDFEYRVFHTEDRVKHVKAVEALVETPVRSILDIGGGQGGLLSCFMARYQPDIAVLLDLDPVWVRAAQVRDPQVTVIRADATNLPFADRSISLTVSTSTLEHVLNWRDMVKEMARVTDQVYLSYGYNKYFPYEKGHIDAPFVTLVPKTVAQYIAYAWGTLRGRPRKLGSIRKQLDETVFLSRGDSESILKRSGMATVNVFEKFLYYSVRSEYHYFAGNLKVYLARHPRLMAGLARMLTTTRTEPIIYLFASRRPGHEGRAGLPSARGTAARSGGLA